MVERGSVQHGGRVDDELAAGVGPLTHGATISAREREDLDPEAPTADESLLVASGDHEDLTGGINYREALERSEIARWLLPSAFPCDTFTLREMASAQGAPDHLIEQVAALPTAGWRAQRDESPRPRPRRLGANREPVLGVGTEPLNGEEVSGDSRENDNTEPITIRDCRYEHRFVLEAGGAISELVYEIVDDRMIIEHTGVPEGLRERGLGGELVRAAAARARDEGLTVVPECPFAQHWLRANPDVAATIRVARTATD